MKKRSLKPMANCSKLSVKVVENKSERCGRAERCTIGLNIIFNTEGLETYFFADWNNTLFDLLVVAGAVEYCDRRIKKPTRNSGREFQLSIPVHEPSRWKAKGTYEALVETLVFLTGDQWDISFRERCDPADQPHQKFLAISDNYSAILPFSDGLDSLSTAALCEAKYNFTLARVRMGRISESSDKKTNNQTPFARLPYKVQSSDLKLLESSGRHRGFKFSVLCLVAGYLASCNDIIVTESFQGALGPALIPVGQGYPDFRSHPRFYRHMESFLQKLLQREFHFELPRLWATKSETLKEYLDLPSSDITSLQSTRSCWQQSRQVGFDKTLPQCGVCAACMLRRMSLHAAGVTEPSGSYVWENLSASNFDEGCVSSFPESRKSWASFKEYAIAGALHLDHLAQIVASTHESSCIKRSAYFISRCIDYSEEETMEKLLMALNTHRNEWEDFLASLGPNSFVHRMIGR